MTFSKENIMSEQEESKAADIKNGMAAIRDFIKKYDAQPERFNDLDLAVFKQALKLIENLYRG